MNSTFEDLTRHQLFPCYFYGFGRDTLFLLNRIDLLVAKGDYHEALSAYAQCVEVEEVRQHIQKEARVAQKDPNFGKSASSYYAGNFHGLAFRENNKFLHRVMSRHYASNINVPISKDLPLVAYSDFCRGATELEARVMASPGKSLSSCLIASMPKSASSFLSSLVSSCCNFEIVQVQFGDPSVAEINPRWLAYLNGNGVTTHSHIEATEFNLLRILEAGVKKIVIQYRDPRAAAWSAVQSNGRTDQSAKSSLARLEAHFGWFNRWLEGWIGVESFLADRGVDVLFVNYSDVVDDTYSTLIKLFEFTGHVIPKEIISREITRARANLRNYNFRTGDAGEWSRNLNPQLKRVWRSKIKPEAYERIFK